MARPSASAKRSLLLCLVALLATGVLAQNSQSSQNSQQGSQTSQVSQPTGNTQSGGSSRETNSASGGSSASSATGLPNISGSRTTTGASSQTSRATLPNQTTTRATSMPKLPPLGGTYSYPAPTVPPTNNAPFMKTSSLPQGTVFIAVGAILGAFGAAVLLWRAIVACLLHRSVKRAALAQHMANDKAPFPGPAPAPLYKYSDRASSVASIGAMAGDPAAARGVRRTNRGPTPSATPSQTNLFFSPTAPNAAGLNSVGNRGSGFLPSGFYAAGSGAPQQGHGHSISLTNLRPESRGHGGSNLRPDSRGHSRLGHSPPDSPALGPRHDLGRRNFSTTSLNVPPTGRTPSTYLEDLLDDQHTAPPPPGHSQTWGPARDRH